jgi:hypothetical protein
MGARDRSIVDYARWEVNLGELAKDFADAAPFPHVVLDDFFAVGVAEVAAEFSRPGDGWIHYRHVNERKFGLRDRARFGPATAALVDELGSPRFIAWLERLTGIEGLVADPLLEGGGLHLTERGGFLNVHADFTVHPHAPNLRRRLNVLVYLNEDWRAEWGGELELWDAEVSRAVVRIAPLANRVVVFRTDHRSFHGHPEPLACPANRSRRSIALYYYTRHATPPEVRSTDYRARPGEGVRRIWIRADTFALRIYDAIKRRLGLDDRAVSWLLARLSRRRPKR